MRAYTVIVHDAEPEDRGFWAEVEELPGCFAAADTLDELEGDVRDAIESYLLALEEIGEQIPEPLTEVDEGIRRWQIGIPVVASS